MKVATLPILLPILALAVLGCGKTFSAGDLKAGQVVDAEGAGLIEAQKNAVGELFGLFLSSSSAAAERPVLERDILSHASAYIERHDTLDASGGKVRIRALILYPKLGKDLEALGLVKPAGVKTQPRLSISIEERDAAAGRPGHAAQALGRVLSEKGYEVDYGGVSSAPAEILVTGQAGAFRIMDQRLEELQAFKARLDIEATGLERITQEASAVDALADSAVDKALSNAGELAGEKLKTRLSSRYQEREEIALLVIGLGGRQRTQKLIDHIRGMPLVAAAFLDSMSDNSVRLRVFIEKMSIDELAATIVKDKSLSLYVRVVEPGYHYLEMADSEVF